jgi:cytochrome c oxidase subunit II
VLLQLTSKDVIHSFWVPNIGGKKDAVPGRPTELWIKADKPGTYKGQCYEFCGTGHADMLVTLVVHPKADYEAWATSAVKDANLLLDPATKTGRETFLSLACVGCHTIKGTPASGKVGPDLTHVASKKSIAGGVVSPVDEANLTRWIKNPPAVKPGTLMPNLGLSDQQVSDIVKFLLTLKCKPNEANCP